MLGQHFQDLELSLVLAIVKDDAAEAAECLTKWGLLRAKLHAAQLKRQITMEEELSIATICRRIRCIAQLFLDLQKADKQSKEDVQNSARLLLRTETDVESASHTSGSRRANGDLAVEPAFDTYHMRLWMLQHIDHPFPSAKDKGQLASRSASAAQVGERVPNHTRCTLWFINSRRRSGWTAWARRFAAGDRNRIRAIVCAMKGRKLCHLQPGGLGELEDSLEELAVASDQRDKDLTKSQFADLCKQEFARVEEWIRNRPRERVGDWVERAIAEAEGRLATDERQANNTTSTSDCWSEAGDRGAMLDKEWSLSHTEDMWHLSPEDMRCLTTVSETTDNVNRADSQATADVNTADAQATGVPPPSRLSSGQLQRQHPTSQYGNTFERQECSHAVSFAPPVTASRSDALDPVALVKCQMSNAW